jgi:hypothetical protein
MSATFLVWAMTEARRQTVSTFVAAELFSFGNLAGTQWHRASFHMNLLRCWLSTLACLSKLRLTAYEEKNLSRLGETLVDQAPHSHYKSGTKRTEARERDDGLKKFSLCGCGAV